MRIRLLILPLALLCMSLSVSAQDPNFSQFFASPLTMNPAMTGKFDGLYRVAGNYRNQWPSISRAYTTGTVSYDMGILKNNIPYYDQFGVGVIGFTDRAGDGALVNNMLGLSLAYHKALDENGYHQLGAGFQGVYSSKRLDVTNLKFQDQLTPFGFTGVTNEIFTNDQLSLSYFDLNAGLLYNGTTDGANNIYFGASVYHINKPKESFRGGNYTLNPRLTLQAGGRVPLANLNNIYIASNVSVQGNARNIMFGGAYSHNVNNDEEVPTNVYLGAWYRYQDAIIPYIGLEFGEWRLGASYDVNVSSLRPASNARGGIELSIIYIKQPVDKSLRKLNCPKF